MCVTHEALRADEYKRYVLKSVMKIAVGDRTKDTDSVGVLFLVYLQFVALNRRKQTGTIHS